MKVTEIKIFRCLSESLCISIYLGMSQPHKKIQYYYMYTMHVNQNGHHIMPFTFSYPTIIVFIYIFKQKAAFIDYVLTQSVEK